MGDGPDVTLLAYPNLTRAIGAVISSRLATLHELETVYGAGDVYDFLEVINVDGHNRRLLTPK